VYYNFFHSSWFLCPVLSLTRTRRSVCRARATAPPCAKLVWLVGCWFSLLFVLPLPGMPIYFCFSLKFLCGLGVPTNIMQYFFPWQCLHRNNRARSERLYIKLCCCVYMISVFVEPVAQLRRALWLMCFSCAFGLTDSSDNWSLMNT